MLLCNLALDIDLSELDSFLFIKLKFEFLVLLTSFFKEFHSGSFLFDSTSISFTFSTHDVGFTHSDGCGFLRSCFSEHFLSTCIFVCGYLISISSDDDFLSVKLCSLFISFSSFHCFIEFLISFELGGLFGSFSTFDFLDKNFLCLGFCESDNHLLLTVCTSESFGVLDFLLLDHHCFLNSDTFFDNVLDFLFLNFNRFVFLD